MNIAFFQHDVGGEEAAAVYDAIVLGDLTTGHQQQKFKDTLRDEFGFGRVALCNSGTSALFLALKALGVGPGDEVITTAFTGIWTVNPILMVGATPVFADIDRVNYNLDPARVSEVVTERTKVCMPVSVNGVPCDIKGLRAALPDHVRLVCDDIEALGARRGVKYVGADIGHDVSVNGFWVSKTVTTCSGGMITSHDKELIEACDRLARHGHGQVGDMWNPSFGYNFAFPDPLAAMGVAQIVRWKEKQRRLYGVRAMLDEQMGWAVKQRPLLNHTPVEFVYMIELPDGFDKRRYADAMMRKDVPTRPYFTDLTEAPHLSPWKTELPITRYLAAKTIALPYHWKLTQDEVDQIVQAHHASIRECAP
jgi:perosamine synthetase